MSLKLVPFKSLGAVSYLPSIVTMAVSVTFPKDSPYLFSVLHCIFPVFLLGLS